MKRGESKMIINRICIPQHTYINDNDFMWNYTNYEHDKETNRYYRLEASCSLRPSMDGALVKHRISKAEYMDALKKVKEILKL